jgi:hypothetical protein
MKRRRILWILLPVILLPLTTLLEADGTAPKANRDALIADVCRHVKVMRFNTDRPVHDVRLTIDGKEVTSDRFNSTKPGFNIAVVISPASEKRINVWYEVDIDKIGGGYNGGYLKGQYREIREANVMEAESFGAGTNLVLDGWTTVYTLRQSYIGATNDLYAMRLEIK